MVSIVNNDIYLQRMQAGLYDKVHWIDKIDSNVNTIIDFGAATGDLFKFIEDMFPGKFTFIGIETNEDFLANTYPNATYYKSIYDVECDWEHAILVMNSVIHEIYSYLNSEVFKDILTYVLNKHIRHIAIREMYLSYSDKYYALDWANDIAVFANKVYKKQWAEHLASYSADEPKDIIKQAIEFVLKYTYIENWNREVNERYLHNEMFDDIGHVLSKYNFHNENSKNTCYYFDYEVPFTIPQQIDRIVTDFGYFPDDVNTHTKLLITRGDLNE